MNDLEEIEPKYDKFDDNLLEETEGVLNRHNKTFKDIVWVGTKDHYVDKKKFLELSDINYDGGYGAQEVADNLLIVGDNWWLERHEYDGSEWWEYKELPIKPNKKIELKALTISQADKLGIEVGCGWETLERINGVENGDR